MQKVLTIAGSDSSGGAGIQTDLKTFAACGVYGMSAITAITAQNTMGVRGIQNITPDMVQEQIAACIEDIGVDAVKIGMLSKAAIIGAVGESLRHFAPTHIVLDPVMISTSGYDLISEDAKQLLVDTLLPMAEVITPNLNEGTCIASLITGATWVLPTSLAEMETMARTIQNHTGQAVLLKGGHLTEKASDLLLSADGTLYVFDSERIDTKNTHGTGCTLSSAIAAYLALGHTLPDAVKRGKAFITAAIRHSLAIGQGNGPTNPMGDIYERLQMK